MCLVSNSLRELGVIRRSLREQVITQFMKSGKFAWRPTGAWLPVMWQHPGGPPPLDYVGLNFYSRCPPVTPPVLLTRCVQSGAKCLTASSMQGRLARSCTRCIRAASHWCQQLYLAHVDIDGAGWSLIGSASYANTQTKSWATWSMPSGQRASIR